MLLFYWFVTTFKISNKTDKEINFLRFSLLFLNNLQLTPSKNLLNNFI